MIEGFGLTRGVEVVLDGLLMVFFYSSMEVREGGCVQGSSRCQQLESWSMLTMYFWEGYQ